jgi:hypothetical protein
MPSPTDVFHIVLYIVGYLVICFGVDRALPHRVHPTSRLLSVLGSAVGLLLLLDRYCPDYRAGVSIVCIALCLLAVVFILYDRHRRAVRRPISERWRKLAAVTLGVLGILAYFNGFKYGYSKYYHRWDQYHYYMGAKYFPELGYDGLYRCAAVAQDQLGKVAPDLEGKRPPSVDLKAEVRDPDKKIRNLGGDNLLMPVTAILDHPEQCTSLFAPERWEKFKADVRFFRIASGKSYWSDMQRDHGYNPPPVWTVAGRFFAELQPAGERYMQFLAMLDVAYLLGMFVVIVWAWGWEIFAVAATFWGTQAPAPFYWTGGAFLRQDWLFFLVLAIALAHKGWNKSAGAAMVYTGLLRIFSGMAVIGWLVVCAYHLVRHRRLLPAHRDAIIGGVIAAAVLIPVSVAASGPTSYQEFYNHTLQVHDKTPLTNHMGLRVLIQHDYVDWKLAWPPLQISKGKESGRMKYARNGALVDPFEEWKDQRNDADSRYKIARYSLLAVTLAWFAWCLRRTRSLWVAGTLARSG